jgi:hypothetical protein
MFISGPKQPCNKHSQVEHRTTACHRRRIDNGPVVFVTRSDREFAYPGFVFPTSSLPGGWYHAIRRPTRITDF